MKNIFPQIVYFPETKNCHHAIECHFKDFQHGKNGELVVALPIVVATVR